MNASRSTWLNPVLLAVLATLSLVWPLFTAMFYISVLSEDELYVCSLVGTITGMIILLCRKKNPPSKIARKATTIGAVVSLLVIAIAWRRSNDLFFYWTLHTKSAADWQMVSRETQAIQDHVFKETTDTSVQLSMADIPAPLKQALGKRSDFCYGYATRDGSRFEITIAYGNKMRRWGIYQGDKFKIRWPNAQVQSVNQNLYYFVTHDY